MKKLWLPCLIFLAASLPAAPVIKIVQDGGGRLVFTYAIADSLSFDSAGPVLPGALPDRDNELFFSLVFAFPHGASIQGVNVSGTDGPVKCVSGQAGLVRSAYIIPLRLYPVSVQNGVSRLSRSGKISVSYTVPLARTALAPARPESGPAEDYLKRTLANYATSKDYRAAPAGPLAKAAVKLSDNAKIKLFTPKDGIYAVSYAAIENQGFNPSAVDPATFRLFSAGKEVPLYVENAVKGRFLSGDRILFYGEHARGPGGKFYPEQTFSRAYYLDWGGGLGLRAPLVSAAPKYLDSTGTVKFFDPLVYTTETYEINEISSFRCTVHVEIDEEVRRLADPGEVRSTSDVPVNPEFEVEDYWFWTTMCKNVNFQTFRLPSRKHSTGKARIKVNFVGYSAGGHSARIVLNGKDVPSQGSNSNEITWTGQNPVTFVSENSLTNLRLIQPDTNTLSVLLPAGDCVFLNWIEVEYDALPGLAGGLPQVISLDAGNVPRIGSYLLSMSGITGTPEIWDVGGRRFTDFHFQGTQLDFYDILEKPAKYMVAPSVFSPEVRKKVAADLGGPGDSADLLIVVPDNIRTVIEDFVAYKRSRGLKVFVAPVEAVYDQFGDGSVDPGAIKAYVRYAYETFGLPPFYLLLIGDTSEGSDKKARNRNLVPTFFVQVDGWGIASADSRFTTVSGDDLFCDLAVGRIPGKNGDEIQKALKKIMDYENASEPGPWKDNYLLLGGWENIFTVANGRFQNTILKDRFNVERVDADPSSPFNYPNSGHLVASDLLNSGALFTCFYGHGGGSVWSDGTPPLMDHAGTRALANYASLPVVFSLTCLTASFEAVTFGLDYDLWPPLGETMFLSDRGGCAAFYGASGHSFTTSDYRLGLFITANSADPSMARVGDIIFGAEQGLLSAYGTQYFSVVGQFNLLGDPSMAVKRPGRLSVALKNPVLSAGDTLVAYLASDSIPRGHGLVRIFKDNGEISFYQPFDFDGRHDTVRVAFKPAQAIVRGIARFMVWDNFRDASGQAPFTLEELSPVNVRAFTVSAAGETLSVQKCVLGDTVHVESGFYIPAGLTLDAVVAAWAPDTAYTEDSIFQNTVPMVVYTTADSGRQAVYRTAGGIYIDEALFADRRGLTYCVTDSFHGADSVPRVRRDYFHLTVAASPDIGFTTAGQVTLGVDGRLVSRIRFVNNSETPSGPFYIDQYRIVNTHADTSPNFRVVDGLAARGSGQAEMAVDPAGFFELLVTLDSRNEVVESKEGNNTYTACFGAAAGTLGRLDSVLYPPGSNVRITARDTADTLSLFCVVDNIDSLDTLGAPVFSSRHPFPLSTLQAFFRPRGALDLERYDFSLLADAAADSAVRVTYQYDTGGPDSLGFYRWDPSIGFWKWVPGQVDTTDSTVSMIAGPNQRLAPGKKLDFKGPDIFASVNGRLLAYKDYIPLNTPIDITLRDQSGVDTHKVFVMLSRNEPVARGRYAMGYAGPPGDVNLTFKPSRQGADSIYIVAYDINGNVSDTAGFGYQLGSNLSLAAFANHPNPFGRNTIFAFTITDDADVDIKIYTLAGNLIKSFSRRNVIGYQEIEWDATDDKGRRLANGVYYLKITVSNENKTIEKIFKIAKAEGR